MDSKEILRQYIIGAMNSKSAIAELEKSLASTSTLLKIQEAARARYVIGFIRRTVQYGCGESSEKDFCLNLRDAILILGRIKLNEQLYEVARSHASEFDFVCENDFQVSCILHMNWELYRSTMERYAIKTDDMATEDAYFMATHMPFSSLELFRGGYYEEGKMPVPTKLMSEDEVFDELIYNPDNEHRMIIVRGNHGTGKSHLIRYLKGKFERSPSKGIEELHC